jgi:hypothetical protein
LHHKSIFCISAEELRQGASGVRELLSESLLKRNPAPSPLFGVLAQACQDGQSARLVLRGAQIGELPSQEGKFPVLGEAAPQCPNGFREDVVDGLGNEGNRQAGGSAAFDESEASRRPWRRLVSPGDFDIAPESPEYDFGEQSSFATRRDGVAGGPLGISSGGCKVPIASVFQCQG